MCLFCVKVAPEGIRNRVFVPKSSTSPTSVKSSSPSRATTGLQPISPFATTPSQKRAISGRRTRKRRISRRALSRVSAATDKTDSTVFDFDADINSAKRDTENSANVDSKESEDIEKENVKDVDDIGVVLDSEIDSVQLVPTNEVNRANAANIESLGNEHIKKVEDDEVGVGAIVDNSVENQAIIDESVDENRPTKNHSVDIKTSDKSSRLYKDTNMHTSSGNADRHLHTDGDSSCKDTSRHNDYEIFSAAANRLRSWAKV